MTLLRRHALISSLVLLIMAALATADQTNPNETDEANTDLFDEAGIDLFNLDECLPMRMQDAYVVSHPVWADGPAMNRNSMDVATCIQWGKGDCNNWTQGKVRLIWPLSDDLQGTIGVLLRSSDFDQTGNGDILLELKHQLHNNVGTSAALWGIAANLPTGQDYARMDDSFPGFSFVVNERDNAIDWTVFGVYTRVLDVADRERLHAQMNHTFVHSAPQGFKSNRWSFSVGYDRQLDEKTLGMAGIWWEESPSDLADDSAALQLGLRRKESPRFLWGTSLDVGLGWQDANWGLSLSGLHRL